MSRIGKAPIAIPDKVEVKLSGGTCTVKGPKGTLSWTAPEDIEVKVEGKVLKCIRPEGKNDLGAKHGLARAMINNMIVGVTEGFKKDLTLVGVGYRAKVEGKNLVLNVGYSNPKEIAIPEGLKVEVSKKQDELSITGIDKQLLGEWCAVVRRIRPPEPYKGKGIRYTNEVVKTKQGKRVGA